VALWLLRFIVLAVAKSPAPDSACLDEVEASNGVSPSFLSRSSFVVVVVGSRWCFALSWERLLVNHLRNRPIGGRVSGDVSDSANAKGSSLSVVRSETWFSQLMAPTPVQMLAMEQ
jgi:hypothetical protein